MLNEKLKSRKVAIVAGLLIFFVPFFTYLSPQNLKQVNTFDVLEILLSLIIILILIFVSSWSFEMLMKRFFNKKIILFPLLCFAFYLNFLYGPSLEFVRGLNIEYFGPIGTLVFIFFELCCLAVIVFGAKFNPFSTRMILIFSILMLINAFIPLVGYLAENFGKSLTISYEINNNPLTQDKILKKRNVYYIILDEMTSIEAASEINITSKKEVLNNLSNAGLKYIDKSQSSYSNTYLTLASIISIDYHQKPSSLKYNNRSNFFPQMMHKQHTEIPLISYLEKANSSFIWSGNSWSSCIPSISSKWLCINKKNDYSIKNSFKFYLTTPFTKIYKIIVKSTETQDSIDKFLKYIDDNGVPKNPFFAFIHHLRPHPPWEVTDECEPANYFNQNYDGYKASYLCTLKQVIMFTEKINNIDPEAIVVFQGDHGMADTGSQAVPWKNEDEKTIAGGKIFNAIKAPETCFEKYGLPKTNVNTVRFTLNCAYGFKLPYRKNIHYKGYYEKQPDYGTVVEKYIYE